MATAPKKKIFDLNTLRRIFSFARPYKRKFYGSLFLSLFLAIMAPIRPWLIQLTVNKGTNAGAEGFWVKGLGGFIIEITIIQIVFLFFETFCRFIFSFITAQLGQHVVNDMRNTVFSKVLQLNLKQFDTTPIGTLTTRTINDVESINEVFSDGLIPIIADVLTIISVLCYMLYADPKLTLVCLAPFPVLLLATYVFKESVNKSFTKVRNAVSNLNAFVQEHITGMSIVQVFAAEDKEFAKFKAINKQHRDANIKAIFAYSVFFPIVELIMAISIGLLVWWAANEAQVIGADKSTIGGNVTSFILCLSLLYRPLRIIADKFNVLQMGMIAGERVFKLLDEPDVTSNNGKVNASNIKGKIEFNHVNFGYLPTELVLKDISFQIEAGETLAIVGATGSGKTSIISLINRLYQINSGSICIDGTPLDDYELKSLRSKVAVVLQDVFLFSGSIRDNVTLHNDDLPIENVVAVAKQLGIHDFIETLPGAYNYNVMERGATLSLGQRQLLSFARALLYNPAILILDEATSSVDTESERLIQHAIDTMIKGRTSIIIAHRLSTIQKAHKILVLDKGQMVELGSHAELMAKQGAYYKLHQMQFKRVGELVN